MMIYKSSTAYPSGKETINQSQYLSAFTEKDSHLNSCFSKLKKFSRLILWPFFVLHSFHHLNNIVRNWSRDLFQIWLKANSSQKMLAFVTSSKTLMYRKVASSRLFQLVAHSRIFRLSMKGKLDAYVLWPLAKKSSKLNSRPVYCSRLYCK